MKKMLCILLAALLMASVCGIAWGEETEVPQALITPERLLELSELTDAGLDMQDVADIIAEYSLTEDFLMGKEPEAIAESLLFCLKHLTKYDFSYLLKGEAITPADRSVSFSGILRMAAWSDNDVLHPTWMIDLQKGRCYYDGGRDFLKDVREAELSFDLTEDFTAAVQAIIEKGDWSNWEYAYTGDTSEYGVFWQLAIETPEGVLRYTLSGFNSHAPEGLYDVSNQIFQLFWDKE